MVSENGHTQSCDPLLAELAALYGVQTWYRDWRGRRRESPRASVCQVLDALGAGFGVGEGEAWEGSSAPPLDPARLATAIRARRAEIEGRIVEPVLVAWDGVLPPVDVRPSEAGPGRLELTLTLEGGEEMRSRADRDRARSEAIAPRWGRLPLGYHRLRVESGGSVVEATVISAPRRCWAPEPSPAREWGVFVPTYALPGDRDWGAGDLADLEWLRDQVAAAGGTTVATLPLLAGYLDCPFEPSPYRPVSRLFWNEFYLAPERAEGWEQCAGARELWTSAQVQAQVAKLRAGSLVDYRAVMALKRRVLEELCRCFFGAAGVERKKTFAEYVRTHPEAEEYAAFRARVEEPSPCASDAERYHLFCQWQMEEQLARLSQDRASGRKVVPGLFLDLPLGVHPGGFDTWRWPELFVGAMSTGAPPDGFFSAGQDWESPPLHPGRAREQGHQYFARCVRHQMRYARYLRIDHVMSLHRLFWIPQGGGPADGVYVTYPAEELYAVLCLESHRNETVVAGEDLGTVPAGTRAAMRRRGILGAWVLQGSVRPGAARPLGAVPRRAVAGLGTHDMFPLAGFVRGDDIAFRAEIGQVDAERARRESAARRRLVAALEAALPSLPSAVRVPVSTAIQGAAQGGREEATLLSRALSFISRSEAALVLVNLEDLLLETRPQNLPGTGGEWGNWRRKVAGSRVDIAEAIADISREMGLGEGRNTTGV